MGWTTPKDWGAELLQSAHMDTYISNNLSFLKENIALAAPTELTIAGGVVTKTKAYHTIDTAADAATDDLDTINGGSDGDVIFLQAEHTDRTVVVKDNTGNIHTGGDIYLDDDHKLLGLMYHAATTHWHHIGCIAQLRTFMINAMEGPAIGTDWTISLLGATLVQNRAAKVFWIPLSFFKIGDQFISYKLVGDVVESANATVDCKLVRVNKADPITSSDIAGGAITQVVADGNFDVEATLTAAETIATDKQYVLQVTGTTGAGDSLTVMGAEVKVVRLL